MNKKPRRDLESVYAHGEFVAKLRRLSDAIEGGDLFEIQIEGERVSIPRGARFSVEHEREGNEEEEVEYQIRWTNP